MARPTHVLVGHVGAPCARCGGTGYTTLGFRRTPKGAICDGCNGAGAQTFQEWITLADFAALFAPGTVRGCDKDGQWFERSVLRVAAPAPNESTAHEETKP